MEGSSSATEGDIMSPTIILKALGIGLACHVVLGLLAHIITKGEDDPYGYP